MNSGLCAAPIIARERDIIHFMTIWKGKMQIVAKISRKGIGNMEIKRDFYLEKLVKRKNNGLVKEITGSQHIYCLMPQSRSRKSGHLEKLMIPSGK